MLLLFITMCSCKNDPKDQDVTMDTENEPKEILEFRLSNKTELELYDITIRLPDTVLAYKTLQKQSQTEWIKVKSAYSYGSVEFFDIEKRQYNIQPIDYVGEELHEKGKMEFIIESIDTLKQNFELNSNYSAEE